jgi:alkanesulfonate monooxygenase SsuD/methylene tetrahydromethanopterin reductase-like flavin-dependent oxidoreductase (luciferase family)
VDPPWSELADAERIGDFYNWTLDELIYGANAGFDGICVNEHHQNAYGFMPSPNLMGSALARATNGMDVAIVQMGSTLPTSHAIRVAEEYAMLDCISGGRLVAGMPLGTSMDVNQVYGIPPIEQRERYREAHDLILKAWRADQGMFAWNGKYAQYPKVNLWPRPIQQPSPPVWVPGVGSYSTWEFALDNNHCYCFLSYFGVNAARATMKGFWELAGQRGVDQNPYRAGYLQLVAVSETDQQAEKEYAEHIEYFYHKSMHIPPHYFGSPGHQDYVSLEKGIRSGFSLDLAERLLTLKNTKYKDFVKEKFVMAGSPETVREQLRDAMQELRVGNLMVLLQIGSTPPELTKKNIDLFTSDVMPYLADMWDDEWDNQWWPQKIRGPRRAVAR